MNSKEWELDNLAYQVMDGFFKVEKLVKVEEEEWHVKTA